MRRLHIATCFHGRELYTSRTSSGQLYSIVFKCHNLVHCLDHVLDCFIHTQEWQDEYLEWNTTEYPDVRELNIPATSIWRPDIHLYGK